MNHDYPLLDTDEPHVTTVIIQAPEPHPSHSARTCRELQLWMGREGRLRGRFPARVRVLDAMTHYGAVKLLVQLVDHRQSDTPEWVMSASIEWPFKTEGTHS